LQKLRNTNRLGGVWKRIDQIALNYKKLFSHKGKSVSVDPYDVGLLLAFAYPERIAHAKPGNNAQFKLANGKIAMIGHKDDLAHEPWITAANLDARDGLGKIFIAAPLNPEDLKPFLRKKEVVRWDSKLDAFIAADELRIGSIVLQSKPLKQVDPALKLKAINEAIAKNPEHLLNINDSFHQLINRISSYGKWNSNKEMELFSEEVLFKHKLEWLSPYLENVTDIDDLKKIDLTEALYHSLDWEFQKLLENEIPQKIAVPSGSSVKLKYSSNGEPPVLAVRIQELFGLLDTPAINNGKQKILLHLLSPGYKPVQVTQDLKSFWSNTYFEVRKELKRRYPKHHWPDHPEKEEPLRGVKKK
ncbi:MAG: hypothetical protein N4A46_03210, partial [Schleiferiaceae bacterium]|nr:hypothetical protein [Schleiferiaceae bacterium]